MPFHLKQATVTLLEQLALTALVTAIFALSDYISNHNHVDWSQVLGVVIVPVSVALLNTVKSFYQTKGDLAAVDIIDQLTPRIQRIEQQLLQVQLAPEAIGTKLVPRPPGIQPMTNPPVPPMPPPGAPKFTAQARTGPSMLTGQAQQLPVVQAPSRPTAPQDTSWMVGPDTALSSFPFQSSPNQTGRPPS
jgi:hypothetical protein